MALSSSEAPPVLENHGWHSLSDQLKVSEEASIPLTNIVICVIYLLPHLIAYSRATAHISLPIFRPVVCFLQQLAHTLWCPYWGAPWGESVRAGESAAGRSTGHCSSGAAQGTCGTTNSTKGRLNTTNTPKNQHRKRKRKDDDEKGPPEQVQKLDTGSTFACPFYLHDRHEWHNCLRNYTLTRIVDVRLHLLRVHLLAPQCPVCGEEFRENSAESDSAEDRCNLHIQLQACEPSPSPLPTRHGLTRDDVEAVRRVAARRNGRGAADPAAEKWFDIWDIVFPNIPRPYSPYITDNADIQRIRDMNDDIFAGEQWRGLTEPVRGSNPSLQNVSRGTLMAIAERFVAMYRRMYHVPGQPASGAEANTVADTPVASSMDNSLQQRHDWEVVSAPSQPAQATVTPLPPVHPPEASSTGIGQQWMLQQTHGHPSSYARPHTNTTTQASQSLYSDFLMDAQIQSSDFSFQDINDLLDPPNRPGSPSQAFNNEYGSSTLGFWGHPGDAADEAGLG